MSNTVDIFKYANYAITQIENLTRQSYRGIFHMICKSDGFTSERSPFCQYCFYMTVKCFAEMVLFFIADKLCFNCCTFVIVLNGQQKCCCTYHSRGFVNVYSFLCRLMWDIKD